MGWASRRFSAGLSCPGVLGFSLMMHQAARQSRLLLTGPQMVCLTAVYMAEAGRAASRKRDGIPIDRETAQFLGL